MLMRNRSGFKCVPKCEKGFYTDVEAKRCVMCMSDCASCSGPGGYCDECPADQFLIETDPEHLHHGRCVTKCPDEFKEDLSDKNIKKCVTVCGANCMDCEGGNLCRRCKDKYFLTSDHRCVNSCGDGYFSDKASRECVECLVDNCKTCSAVGTCTQCTDGYEVHDDGKACAKLPPTKCSSTNKCSSGSFCDKINRVCVRCHPDCAECMGPSFDHCIKCKNNQPVDPRTRQCPSCKPGEYFEAEHNSCRPCGRNCLFCSATSCVQCMAGYGLDTGHCLECCKAGAEKKYNCASCPHQTPLSSESSYSVSKVVILLCIAGVAFFFLVFGILMWKDRNYERDAKKYAYSKVPILYDIGNDTQVIVDAEDDEKRYENGAIQSDDDDYDVGADAEDTLFDKKIIKNGR